MKEKIGIKAWGAVSALGTDRCSTERAYLDQTTCLGLDPVDGEWKGQLPQLPILKGKLADRPRFLEQIDRSVRLALLAADQFSEKLEWLPEEPVGINLGSSRGATGLWEDYHRKFTGDGVHSLSPLCSPTTTLGNLSSWLGTYLGLEGPNISHSVTCSSALQAIINGVAWLESGRCRYFLAGGSEAPLTGFTLAQMRALRIYADAKPEIYPCRSLDLSQTRNTMVLGEGAAIFALESAPAHPLAWIQGFGCAQEFPESPTGISENGDALQRAMRLALRDAGKDRVDVVICHAPGTRKGDAAEYRAIRAVFGKNTPFLTGNKWKIGHTLGASGGLSLEMALLMLKRREVFPIPFLAAQGPPPRIVESIMINAMGFGGNVISLIVGK